MLKIGTDCSGIEAPIQAIKNIGIPFQHVFSCDIDKNCIKSIKANYNPLTLYEDITTRDNKKVKDVDLYIAGFPCQPFSMVGLRKGESDTRGTIFEHCLNFLKVKKPKLVLFENVVGLLSINNGDTFKNIIKSIENEGYKTFHKVLNTKDYGIPQNRKRVFIVCIKDTKKEFTFPSSIKGKKKLSEFIDETDNSIDELPPRAIKSKLLERIPENSVFVDLSLQGRTNFPNSDTCSPCVLRKSDIYCIPKKRRANIKELLSLQGFPKDFKKVVSTSEMKKQIGNSMSVNVIESILREMLKFL